MNKRIKNVIKVATYTICIIVSLLVLSIPSSNMKYIKEERNLFGYRAKFYNLYQGLKTSSDFVELDLLNSTTSDIYLTLKFPKSVFSDSATDDYYQFDIPNTCNVVKVNGTSTNNVAILYENIKDNNTISVRCDVVENSPININIGLDEALDGEALFDYMDFAYAQSYTNYVNTFLTHKAFTRNNMMYADVMTWINSNNPGASYAKNLSHTEEVDNYINGITNEDIINNTFKGLNTSCTSTVCTINIESNMEGYAQTLASSYNRFYFTTTDEDEMNEAFEYYLKQLFPTYTDAEITSITDYVGNELPNLIAGTYELEGITHNDDGSITVIGPTLLYSKVMRTYSSDGYYHLDYDTATNLEIGFDMVLRHNGLTGTAYNNVANDYYLHYMYKQYGVSTNKKSYTSAFIESKYNDSKEYIMFVFESDGVNGTRFKTYTLSHDNFDDDLKAILVAHRSTHESLNTLGSRFKIGVSALSENSALVVDAHTKIKGLYDEVASSYNQPNSYTYGSYSFTYNYYYIDYNKLS